MWHEARKQEKKIRDMMVDYKQRAERRRDYYERIKQDPAQFLQVHGRPAKIHLDPAIAIAAEGPATMMPWQGDTNTMIDRFDVRAHLDVIPEYKMTIDLPKLSGEELVEDRQACYERYRILVQNDFLGLNEDKFLHQIYLEERFGPVLKPAAEEEKKKLMDKKAAIGYVYEDSTEPPVVPAQSSKVPKEPEEEDDDLSDIDLDVTVDVSELTDTQCVEMNDQSLKYGMVDEDFITYLMQDKDEADQLRLAKEIQEEKAMYSGRKCRRERRVLREKKLAGRKISPPSYAARSSPVNAPIRHSTSKSRSRSSSPPNAGKIMFITSFGDEGSEGESAHRKDRKLSAENNLKGSSAKKHKSQSVKHSACESLEEAISHSGSVSKKKSEKGEHYPRLKRKDSVSSLSSPHTTSRETRDGRNKYAKSSRSSSKSSRKRRHSSSSSTSSSDQKKHSKRRDSRSRSSSRSRSQSVSSRSRSRSRSYPARSHSNKSHSRSRSRSVKKSDSPQLPPPPVKSYYRHSLSRSSSEISDDSDSQDRKEDSSSGKNNSLTNKWQQLMGKAGPSTKTKSNPQERLKRRTQIALNRQYKADKKAEMEKSEKQLQERMDREEELREMAIRLRRRERERRHKLRRFGSDSDTDASFSKDRHQASKDHREYNKSQNYTSSEDDRSAKSLNYKSRHRSPSPCISPQKSSLRSPVREHRRNSPVDNYRRNIPVESYRRNSPVEGYRRNPPSESYCRNSPVESYRRNSPVENYRKNSPVESYRRNSPTENYRRNSPNDSYRRNSSNDNYRRNSPMDNYRRKEPGRVSRRSPIRNRSYRSPQRSIESSNKKKYQSRNGEYDHLRHFGYQKSRARSPDRR